MCSAPKAAFLGMLLCCLCLGHRAAQRTQALHVPTRCLCLKFQERVDPRLIVDFQIIEKGAHCHRHEIILKVKDQRERCLDSYKMQGKNLLHCWKRNLKDPRKQSHCVRKRRRPRTRAKQ